MDLTQPGTGMQPGRTASFYDGVNGTPNMVSSGLAQDSAVLNAKVAGMMATPHSVLQGLPGMSPNGKSEADAQRTLPGGYTLPSMNGSSQESYEAATRMRLMGRDTI